MQRNGSIGTVPDYRVNMVEELTAHFMFEAVGHIVEQGRQAVMIQLIFFDGRLLSSVNYSGGQSITIDARLFVITEKYNRSLGMVYGFFSSS